MKNKKIISILISVIILLSISVGGSLEALAATVVGNTVHYNEKDIKKAEYCKVYNTGKGNKEAFKATNIGGLSVGDEHNRLFVIKSNSDEMTSILYYYKNFTDSNIRKNPKKIYFKSGLLGHANAMAIDKNYIYITCWQKYKSQKSQIIRISRNAIHNIKGDSVITYTSKNKEKGTYDQNSKINNWKIFSIITPKDYNKSITAITKYSYKESTNSNGTKSIETKFIINHTTDKKTRTLSYTIATLKATIDKNNNEKVISFEISKDNKDIMYVTLPKTYDECDGYEQKESTYQDIYYHKQFGLFIVVWHPIELDYDKTKDGDPNYYNNNQTGNSIFRVNTKNFGAEYIKVKVPDGNGGYKKDAKGNFVLVTKKQSDLTAAEKKYTYGNKFFNNKFSGNDILTIKIDMWEKYNKFEIESMSFVIKEKDAEGNVTKFNIIFTANIATDKLSSEYDVVGLIENVQNQVKAI